MHTISVLYLCNHLYYPILSRNARTHLGMADRKDFWKFLKKSIVIYWQVSTIQVAATHMAGGLLFFFSVLCTSVFGISGLLFSITITIIMHFVVKIFTNFCNAFSPFLPETVKNLKIIFVLVTLLVLRNSIELGMITGFIFWGIMIHTPCQPIWLPSLEKIIQMVQITRLLEKSLSNWHGPW